MTKPYRITAPAALAVGLSEIKAQLFIDYDDYDFLLSTYIQAGVDHLDGLQGILGRCLVSQEWGVKIPEWSKVVTLPFCSASNVVVSYFDVDANQITVSPSDYSVIETSGAVQVVFNSRFENPSVSQDVAEPITFRASFGFGGSQDVPAAIKLAIMQLVAHWYENRAAVTDLVVRELPMGVDRLLAPYRKVSF